MRLNNIQILRGISALLVCCFHFRSTLNFADFHYGDALFRSGSIGVQIFFIISGFIMVFTTKNINLNHTKKSLSTFLKKRIIRIIPLYYILTIAWIILGGGVATYLLSDNIERLYKSFLFLPIANKPPVLFLGWSLNYEMFFYLIFGVSLLFKKYRYHFIIGFFVLLVSMGFSSPNENIYYQFITNKINLYFVVGVFLGLISNKITIDKYKGLLISSVGIILFALFFFRFFNSYSFVREIIFVSLFFFSFLILDKINFKSNRFLVSLGDISYSIYLVHPFVEVLFKKIHPQNEVITVLLFILQIITVIIISKISYEIIEKRGTNYLKSKLIH